MRISVKGRYALAAMIHLAQHYNSGDCITVLSISEKLGISKIYLEQVFSLLRRGKLVQSAKGAMGGYLLYKSPKQITAFDVLYAVEVSLFEPTEETVSQRANDIEKTMQMAVFSTVADTIKDTLSKITLQDLVTEAEKNRSQGFMFYI